MGSQKHLITWKREFIESKIKMKTYSKCFKSLSNVNYYRFCWTFIPTLGPIISGTNCDRDKTIISVEWRGQWDHVDV